MSNSPETITPAMQTETMARLFLNQGHWRQALTIYQQLALREPEKEAFYKEQIAEIKRCYQPPAGSSAANRGQQIRKRIDRLRSILKLLTEGEIHESPDHPRPQS